MGKSLTLWEEEQLKNQAISILKHFHGLSEKQIGIYHFEKLEVSRVEQPFSGGEDNVEVVLVSDEYEYHVSPARFLIHSRGLDPSDPAYFYTIPSTGMKRKPPEETKEDKGIWVEL